MTGRKMVACDWDFWVEKSLEVLFTRHHDRSLRPIYMEFPSVDDVEIFDGPGPCDRASVEVVVREKDFDTWTGEEKNSVFPPGGRDENAEKMGVDPSKMKRLLLFSGNDYLGLSSHPSVRRAASKAAEECGMGPRGSALVCGHTTYHSLLETALADLKKKDACLLCPTGFAANLIFMSALGSLCTLLAVDKKPSMEEKIAIFSDSLNHASIIDGIHMIQRHQVVQIFVYRHCDTVHLDNLISHCKIEKKVVITDSIFSMDGDFAPILQLVELRKKHKFLLAIDDAHGTFVCGKNGGGVPEHFDCESEVDICIGTLSKGAGCLGGFIACSKKWKHLLQSTGRSFIFSTALPVPIVAAAHAAVVVSKAEKWRRKALWKNVEQFNHLTKFPVTSQIVSIILENEESTLSASKYLMKCGFHVIAIRPPSVPPNSCRLRLTISAAHTENDIQSLAVALSHCVGGRYSEIAASQNSKL
ncbi:8-amino-7-oxononanoate synthase [Zostera marina]|uniref:serine C-palmitoyltransferase n=1 Tax=Zostera marina TaxID=29655 RepID=A0A0K9NS96_ZOSMR|nr:8-amino-7-oxononanoate synthase [Zostera marina]